MHSEEMSVLIFVMASAMLFAFALSGYGAERVANCSMENLKNDVFDASALLKDSRISIEIGTADYLSE